MFTSAMRNLSSGLMLGLIGTVLTLSFAGMLFADGRYSQFQAGITIFLISAVLSSLVIGFFSARPGLAALPMPVAAAVTAALAYAGDLEDPQIRLVLIFSGLLTALLMLLLAQARLGAMIRYLPFGALGGLLAGAGWLIVLGGLRLVQPELLILELVLNPSVWLVLAFAGLLFLAQKKLGGLLVLPTGFLLLAFVFNLLAAGFPEWSGSWFLTGGERSFWSLFWLPQYDRITVGDAVDLPWSGILTLAMISVLVMLWQTASLQQSSDDGADINRDLQATAGGQLLSGLLGGAGSAVSLSQVQLNEQMGGQGKAPVIIAALVMLLFALVGGVIWSYLPLPVFAVVLVYLGLQVMEQWLIDARSRLTERDYQVLAGIFLAVVLVGFMPAALLALLAALGLMLLQNREQQVIHHATDAVSLHSRVERSLRHKKALEKYGDRVRIIRLKGMLRFGAGFTLTEALQARLEPPCVFVILDFSRVRGFDASTVDALHQLHRDCLNKKLILILSALPYELKQQLTRSGLPLLDEASDTRMTTRGLMDAVGVFTDWDRALEWCENELISRLPTNASGEYTLESVLKERMDLLPYEVVHLVRYFEPVDVKAGECFIHQGDKADSLYLITKGQVEIEVEVGAEARQRLKTMMPGTVIGEMGVYTGGVRTASATAVTDTQLMRLTAKSLQEMETHHQLMAVRLHRFVVMLLTQKLTDSNKVLDEVF